MPMNPQDFAAYVDAAAATLDLPLAPEHRPGVLQYFALAAGFARSLEEHQLAVADEPAGLFTPVTPEMVAEVAGGGPGGGGGSAGSGSTP